jgi:hypothetical protein
MQEGVDKIIAPHTGTGGSPPLESDTKTIEFDGATLIE